MNFMKKLINRQIDPRYGKGIQKSFFECIQGDSKKEFSDTLQVIKNSEVEYSGNYDITFENYFADFGSEILFQIQYCKTCGEYMMSYNLSLGEIAKRSECCMTECLKTRYKRHQEETLPHSLEKSAWLYNHFHFNKVLAQLETFHFAKSQYSTRNRGVSYEVEDEYLGWDFRLLTHFCKKCGDYRFDEGIVQGHPKKIECRC